tara:strand:- start:571 stop:1035 length:465 start_codon:yes stop_codon:yes gene_type:complete
MIRNHVSLNVQFGLAFLIVILDQITKFSVQIYLKNGTKVLEFIPHLIQLRLVKNTGAAFSMLSGSTLLLGFLSLSVAIAITIWCWIASPMRFWKGIGIAFILGGTLGNGIDRFRLGYVIDFLEIVPINFPIFNIADISINIAIICLLIDMAKRR